MKNKVKAIAAADIKEHELCILKMKNGKTYATPVAKISAKIEKIAKKRNCLICDKKYSTENIYATYCFDCFIINSMIHDLMNYLIKNKSLSENSRKIFIKKLKSIQIF